MDIYSDLAKLNTAGGSTLNRKEITRQCRVGRRIATMVVMFGWNHLLDCTSITFNSVRDCNWSKEVEPIIAEQSRAHFFTRYNRKAFVSFIVLRVLIHSLWSRSVAPDRLRLHSYIEEINDGSSLENVSESSSSRAPIEDVSESSS